MLSFDPVLWRMSVCSLRRAWAGSEHRFVSINRQKFFVHGGFEIGDFLEKAVSQMLTAPDGPVTPRSQGAHAAELPWRRCVRHRIGSTGSLARSRAVAGAVTPDLVSLQLDAGHVPWRLIRQRLFPTLL